VLASLRLRAWLYSRTEISSPWRFEFTPSHDSTFHIIGSGGGYLLKCALGLINPPFRVCEQL
jgi:hypothetical protein